MNWFVHLLLLIGFFAAMILLRKFADGLVGIEVRKPQVTFGNVLTTAVLVWVVWDWIGYWKICAY